MTSYLIMNYKTFDFSLRILLTGWMSFYQFPPGSRAAALLQTARGTMWLMNEIRHWKRGADNLGLQSCVKMEISGCKLLHHKGCALHCLRLMCAFRQTNRWHDRSECVLLPRSTSVVFLCLKTFSQWRALSVVRLGSSFCHSRASQASRWSKARCFCQL